MFYLGSWNSILLYTLQTPTKKCDSLIRNCFFHAVDYTSLLIVVSDKLLWKTGLFCTNSSQLFPKCINCIIEIISYYQI